jgi:hypothetical protein
MRTILGAAAAAVLAASLLTGCGGGDHHSSAGSAYCTDLEAAKDSFMGLLDNEIGQDSFRQLKAALPTLHAEAPAGIQDDWATFKRAVDTFSAAIRRAGLTMDDMRDMGSGSMPGGVDMRTAMDAAAALGSAALSTAQSQIAANASKVCDLDLNS